MKDVEGEEKWETCGVFTRMSGGRTQRGCRGEWRICRSGDFAAEMKEEAWKVRNRDKGGK